MLSDSEVLQRGPLPLAAWWGKIWGTHLQPAEAIALLWCVVSLMQLFLFPMLLGLGVGHILLVLLPSALLLHQFEQSLAVGLPFHEFFFSSLLPHSPIS